jgi:hypothetical protein
MAELLAHHQQMIERLDLDIRRASGGKAQLAAEFQGDRMVLIIARVDTDRQTLIPIQQLDDVSEDTLGAIATVLEAVVGVTR